MLAESDSKAGLSVSIAPEQRERFYTSQAQFRQQAPFVTKSALVVAGRDRNGRTGAPAAGDAGPPARSGAHHPTRPELYLAVC
jgi:hypothetical protein